MTMQPSTRVNAGLRIADTVRTTPDADRSGSRRLLVGVTSALLVVAIWGSWIVFTRLGVTTTLGAPDLALLRFLIPALALSPILMRKGLAPRDVDWRLTAAIVMGAGAPFYLVCAAGIRLAPAAHVGVLLPGTMPLFVAVMSVLVLGERPGRVRIAGFLLVAAGGLAIIGFDLGSGERWPGHLLLLAAAAMWAVYTLAMRRAGLGAWHAAALVNGYSLVGLLPLYVFVFEPRMHLAAGADLAIQILWQGILSGLVALFAYGQAVRCLGATQAAAFAALAPAVATVIAIPLLGETPDAVTAIGLAAVTVGVALASGAFGRARR